MKLKRLSIQRLESWEGKGEGYKGVLTTASPNSEVSIRLSDESCRKILEIAGMGIKEAAAEIADFVVSEASLVASGKLMELSND
jgi:hypothetical protein